MLNTVGRFIYTKYWKILYVEYCRKIYLSKILGNTLCWTLWEDLFTQNSGYTLCWALWEHLLTQNTGKYFLLNTVGRFIYTKYWEIVDVEQGWKINLHKILENTLGWALWEGLFTQNAWKYIMLNSVRRFIYTKYREILSVKHCWKIYLHNILGNTLCWTLLEDLFTKNTGNIWCWTLWEDLFTRNTRKFFILHSVRKFIYTKY